MLLELLLTSALAVAAAPSGDVVAVQAGTLHLVEDGRVVTGGGTILVRDGKIVAAGPTAEVELPPGARVVDYGPDAVIAPGLVAADSRIAGGPPSDRTADPLVRAADAFDPYSSYVSLLEQGVTTAYVAPARGRLIAGQGAAVKLGARPGDSKILVESTGLSGAISAEARNTPGYWEPPVPATVDVGLGVARKQLPRTTMGAILALRELLALAGGSGDPEEYGEETGPALAELLARHAVWRMGAVEENEIRALLEFFREQGLPLVIDGAREAGKFAKEIAAAGASVILDVDIVQSSALRDLGKGEDDPWPSYEAAARLAAAGVRFAVAPSTGGPELRLAARLASRGGMNEEVALRAITLSPAEILGVDDRVGSIAPGKDADFVVLNGPPLLATSSVTATWVEGEVAWKASETAATVVEVDELHVGDGQVLSPGQLLMEDGRIVEVGRRVAHPLGATVVRGRAAMPGMIDARGHLGLEGSTKSAKPGFPLRRLLEPGDFADRRVAQAGVTTVVLTPRSVGSNGTPAMAYKPAGEDVERMLVEDPAAIHLVWSNPNRLKAGEAVRKLLEKAVEYKRKWDEYEKALAAWTPPPTAEEQKAGEEKAENGEEGNGDDEGSAGGDEDDKGKKKRRKKDEPPPALPVTGVWEATLTAEGREPTRLRLRLLETDGRIEGSLRCDLVSDELVELEGRREEYAVTLEGRTARGPVTVSGEAKEKKLTGKVVYGEMTLEFEAEQKSDVYEVVRRPERRREKPPERKKEPKGKPKAPSVDETLEPLRRAIEGEVAVVCQVDRADEILECVEAFEQAGIRPVLRGAADAWKVADRLRGRVAGVLLDGAVMYRDTREKNRRRNRYAELSSAGIPVAFQSGAEEGAAQLPLLAAYAVSQGMSPEGALRALTADAARMLGIEGRVGRLAAGLDADVILLDGSPLELDSSVQRVWVNGREVR